VWEKSLVAERRLNEVKKRRLNLATNSQQGSTVAPRLNNHSHPQPALKRPA
jgi:hypothetical protein